MVVHKHEACTNEEIELMDQSQYENSDPTISATYLSTQDAVLC